MLVRHFFGHASARKNKSGDAKTCRYVIVIVVVKIVSPGAFTASLSLLIGCRRTVRIKRRLIIFVADILVRLTLQHVRLLSRQAVNLEEIHGISSLVTLWWAVIVECPLNSSDTSKYVFFFSIF